MGGDPAVAASPAQGGGHALTTPPSGDPRFATRRDFSDCVHCGLCLDACPTYLELAQEPDSPRGRIYLMKGLAEARLEPTADVTRHIDLCLGCRACETACPSGVGYGHLVEQARGWLEARAPRTPRESFLKRWIVGRVMPSPGLFRLSLSMLHTAGRVGLGGLIRSVMPAGFDARAWGERLHPDPRRRLPGRIPATPPVHGRVAFLSGCVMDGLFGATNETTVRLLARQGWEVVVPRRQVCCGALLLHAGLAGRARELAAANARLFAGADADFVVTNAAGCGATLKEYGTLLAGRPEEEAARALAGRSRDVTEVLALHPLRGPLRRIRARVAYHDACHLAHGQRITAEPRALLAQIPGITLVPLAESDVCCGSAGSYNITQPGMAARLGARKAAHILDAGADIVVAGNAGCLVQMKAALVDAARNGANSPEVLHTVELLSRAAGG